MDGQAPLRNRTLCNQVLEILAERIRTGAYAPGTQLPSETALAAEFGISRTTVRSALGFLASRGLVVPRQGVGTFVSARSTISDPLDRFIPFPDLIASQGSQPGFEQLGAELIEAGGELAATLQIEPGSEVLRVRKLFSADGTPVVYCINHIPAWVYAGRLSGEEALQPGVTQPIFEFLEHRCGQPVERYVASVRAATIRSCHLQDLALPYDSSTPVLVIDEVGYNVSGAPVHHSLEYHPDNRMKFELVRTRSLLAS